MHPQIGTTMPTSENKLKNLIFHSILWLFTFIIILAGTEICLRAYRSLTYDGGLFLKGSSPNYELHDEYGWMARKNFTHHKNSKFYGFGIASYNAQGFRARPIEEAENADFRVCILGDSYMQGHQMPDGQHLPHILEKALKKKFKNPYVLPLAVGGYGSVQEYMLFEDYGIAFKPDLIIQQWCSNDVINNSFHAEKHNFSNNNVLRRPYFENDKIIYKRPFQFHINNWIDNLVLIKVINILLAKKDAGNINSSQKKSFKEIGWDVANHFTAKITSKNIAPYIALVGKNQNRAIKMFKSHGAIISTYSIPEKYTNLPMDNHPNGKGHQIMLESLLPLIDSLFTTINLD